MAQAAKAQADAQSSSTPAPNPFAPKGDRPEATDLIDMTAMVDIVFFLLIYFLVTSFVALAAAIPAPAPEPKVGKTASGDSAATIAPQNITVRIDADDVITIDDQPIASSQDLIIQLRTLREETEIDALRVAASSEATHGKLIMVLDAGVSAGFVSAQFALEETP